MAKFIYIISSLICVAEHNYRMTIDLIQDINTDVQIYITLMGRCCSLCRSIAVISSIHTSNITKYRIAIWRDAVIRRWEPDMRRDGNCEDIRLGDMRCGGTQ